MLRLCPKHNKPYPCGRCRIENAQKPVQTAPSGKSQAAIRAERWREHKKQNEQFSADEAKRKRDERNKRKPTEEQRAANFTKQHPQFPNNLWKLRNIGERSGLYMAGAPRGKGKLITGGYNTVGDMDGVVGVTAALRQTSALITDLPVRAQLTDAELQQKLADATIGLQPKIDLILEHWKRDEEFCRWIEQLSLDELTEFIEDCSDNLQVARQLLYEQTEHQACTVVLSHAQPHGWRVVPDGISDDHEGDLPRETEGTLWRAFGTSAARVAIVLNIPSDSLASLALGIQFSPVAYLSEKAVHDVVDGVISSIHADCGYLRGLDRSILIQMVFRMLLFGVVCLKHEGFHEEREWRAIYQPKIQSSPLMKSATRVIAGVPQIIYEIPMDSKASVELADLDFAKMFDHIIVGPSPYVWPMYEAFVGALTEAGVEDAPKRLVPSGIPIRA